MIKIKINNNKKEKKTTEKPRKTAENHRIQGCKMDSQKYEKNK